MANTRRRATAAAENTAEAVVSTEETKVSEAPAKTPETKPMTPKDVDPSDYVIVRNGFQGRLVYKSPRTGERFVWDGFGAEQEMELRELRSAKNSAKKFFTNNWFMFDESWIIAYLGVRQYYRNAIPIDHFDDIFKQKPEKLAETIMVLSPGQRRSVAYRAKELIASKEIDSLSTVSTLEDALGIELIQK